MELKNEPHNINLKLQPEIFHKTKVNSIRPWTFITITISNDSFNLIFTNLTYKMKDVYRYKFMLEKKWNLSFSQ